MDGVCVTAGKIPTEGSFQGGEGTWAEAGVVEDLAEVGESAEVDRGGLGNCGWWDLRRGCGNL